MTNRSDIENAILDATGRPDTGVIRDNLTVMVDAIMLVVSPPAAKIEKETRVVKTEETR